jgi:hypothetical protein
MRPHVEVDNNMRVCNPSFNGRRSAPCQRHTEPCSRQEIGLKVGRDGPGSSSPPLLSRLWPCRHARDRKPVALRVLGDRAATGQRASVREHCAVCSLKNAAGSVCDEVEHQGILVMQQALISAELREADVSGWNRDKRPPFRVAVHHTRFLDPCTGRNAAQATRNALSQPTCSQSSQL